MYMQRNLALYVNTALTGACSLEMLRVHSERSGFPSAAKAEHSMRCGPDVCEPSNTKEYI